VASNQLFSCHQQLQGKIHHAQHLLQMVQKYFTCLYKKEGERYCALTIKWNYAGKKVHLLMPSYVEKAIKRFQHPPPIVPQDQLHQHIKKTYDAKFQEANPLNTSPPLDKSGKKFIQEVTGYFFILRKLLIQPGSLRSAHLRPNTWHLQKRQCKNAYNS
jgi:hypothetical protein